MKIRNQRARFGPFKQVAHPGVPADHFQPVEEVSPRQLRKVLAKVDREIAKRRET